MGTASTFMFGYTLLKSAKITSHALMMSDAPKKANVKCPVTLASGSRSLFLPRRLGNREVPAMAAVAPAIFKNSRRSILVHLSVCHCGLFVVPTGTGGPVSVGLRRPVG